MSSIKMSRPILSRPRTRVYGCNYDKGESYYKPMVDNLDRKYSGRPLFSEPRTSLADEIAARRNDIGSRDLSGPRNNSFGRDLDLELDPRPRASQTSPLTDPLLPEDEDTVYDSRGQRTRRRVADDFANEVSATTQRFKQRLAAIGLDEDIDVGLPKSRRARPEQDLLESSSLTMKKTMQNARSLIEDAESSFKRRTKLFDEAGTEEAKPSLTRWSKFISDDEDLVPVSAAATRAKQTKARLNDLESEMEELAERQAKRERRAAALRALVNENAVASEDVQQQAVLSKKVSVRSERIAEKHVAF